MRILLFGLITFSAQAQAGFSLPENWKEVKAARVQQIKAQSKRPRRSLYYLCSRYAAKSMTQQVYEEILVYEEITGTSCGEMF